MEMAIAKARAVGVGTVTVRNSRHLGALGHFARIATEHDMIGMCMSASGSVRGRYVLPTFAAVPRLGTNPLAISAPTRNQPVFLFDIATSAVAGNKIRLARRLGSLMAPGWIAAPDGTPIMEPSPVPEGEVLQLPIGGNREQGSHKGYGLSLMVEVLAGMLAASTTLMIDASGGSTHAFMAWDIAAFTEVETFKDNIDTLFATLRATPPAPGHERVIYPGVPEFESEQERRAHGIPLHREVIGWFDATTAELGLPPLARPAG
jgi:LDH2 family malate/lactate/ureidoglycolate dehydrogenase